jgi:hypothetical protein
MDSKIKHIEAEMKRVHTHNLLLAFTKAATPKEFFGFDHLAVREIHYRHRDLGAGTWFRLRDGSVFCDLALPAEQCRSAYA